MKRYIVQTSFYIYAESDQDAIEQANEVARKQDLQLDDKCSVDQVISQPFGSLQSRQLKIA